MGGAVEENDKGRKSSTVKTLMKIVADIDEKKGRRGSTVSGVGGGRGGG